jgi:hypothetical protein
MRTTLALDDGLFGESPKIDASQGEPRSSFWRVSPGWGWRRGGGSRGSDDVESGNPLGEVQVTSKCPSRESDENCGQFVFKWGRGQCVVRGARPSSHAARSHYLCLSTVVIRARLRSRAKGGATKPPDFVPPAEEPARSPQCSAVPRRH